MAELPRETGREGTVLEATEAFKLLGDETRLSILVALWRAEKPLDGDQPDPTDREALSFSELRERVEYETSSNFTYHLDQLVGTFVRRTDEGYELLPAGDNLIHAIVASAGFVNRTVPPAEVETDCLKCGASTAITYQNQRLYHVCTECEGVFDLGDHHPSGVLGGWISNPAILGRGPAEEVHTAVRTEIFHLFAMRAAGVCPKCSGRVEWELHVCDDHDLDSDRTCSACNRDQQSIAEFVCRACKNTGIVGFSQISLRHPAVVSLFWEHGVELGYDRRATTEWLQTVGDVAEVEVSSTEPPRVCVTFCLEDDELQLTYDEEMNVDVTEDGSGVDE